MLFEIKTHVYVGVQPGIKKCSEVEKEGLDAFRVAYEHRT
jgi:hypothetical protein